MKIALSIALSIMFSLVASADPSTDVLLNSESSRSSSNQDPVSSGLQSGRYQTKDPVPGDEPTYKTSKSKKKNKAKRPASEAEAIPAPEFKRASAASEEATDKPEASPAMPPPSLGDQVQDLFHGGAAHTNETYREQIHADDIRNNRVEIDVVSGVTYDNSTSNLLYRNYYSFAPFLKVDGHVWLTPLVGISGSYLSTFSETIPSATNGSSSVNAKSAWTQASLDFRKFFGMSRRANSLNYGLLYSQYNFTIPSSETSRVGLTTSGLGLYMNARIPTAPSYAWVFGGSILPVLSHAENQTGLNLQSGTSNTASRIGLSLGGEIKMSRENQLIWSVEVQMEKDQFSGLSSLPDPMTGQAPNGVSVVNTWTYFNLGYRWGQ